MSEVNIQDLSVTFPEGSPPRVLKFFRNGVAPPASGGRQLANQLNTLLARRLRPLASYTNVYGLHANFDSTSTSDLTCHRFAFRTGPVTEKIKWAFAALPYIGTPSAADVTITLTLTTGLSGTGTSTTISRSVPMASTGLTADDLMWFTAELDVTADSFYRAEIHRTNLARMVSTSIHELLPWGLETDDYTVLSDTTTFFDGGPITQQQTEALIMAGDKLWRRGHPLGWWSIDIPGDERSRTSATAANLWDQTIATPTSISPGWPVNLPYSGSLDSSNVPVIFWCYAECTSGSGSVTFRDQNNTTLGTITPVGAATWYYVAGNLTDNTDGTITTKVDAFFAGDATNACKVYACGMFMDGGDDTVLNNATVSPAEWLPRTFGGEFRKKPGLTPPQMFRPFKSAPWT